ncbi:MAG: hypothetical protein J6S13_00215 [Clostridia bacterium]|nr:hypothetical protein [Clostridia bacterium]
MSRRRSDVDTFEEKSNGGAWVIVIAVVAVMAFATATVLVADKKKK